MGGVVRLICDRELAMLSTQEQEPGSEPEEIFQPEGAPEPGEANDAAILVPTAVAIAVALAGRYELCSHAMPCSFLDRPVVC